ncbi:MAG: T9SS type A sorting domain-containing protein [Bacteroidales bacterium]|nr:T9SS type A sorting domain-containing protein [Bacteroidales bacterium]
MKKSIFLIVFLFLGMSFLFAQEETQKPTVILPNYFDISPPLRDMVQQSDAIIDNSWKEGIVKNKLNAYSNESSNYDSQGIDAVLQSYFGDAVSDTTIQNFDGVSANGSYPPDTDGDVSNSHYMQVVNTRFAVYDKNGNKLMGPTNSSVIFNGLPNNSNDGDAILLYDENADRWLFSQFSLPNYPNGPFYENVAISQTNNPTGSWYRYQFSFTDMPDYPKLGVWVDGYYMTTRRFQSGTGNWLGPAAVAMDRAKMLVGDPTAAMVMFTMPSSAEGTQAADCDSDFPAMGSPCPVCYLVSTATASVRLYNFSVNWTTPTSSTFNLAYTIPITTLSTLNGNSIPQKGTSQKLDAMSGRRIMFRMPYRKFSAHSSMLINTTVNVGGVAGIRWMELRNVAGTWSLYQEGTYAPGDGHYRWMGSIAMDSSGNIALGYSISSTNMFPSIRYTGRMNGDPLGVMTIAEKGIINGGGSQTNTDGRWGDYSAMAADPSVNGKFWYTQEYYSTTSNSSWKTRIGSFSFSNVFSAVATAVPNPVCLGDSTQLNVSANGGSGTYTYSWTSIPPGFTSTLQGPKVAPTDTTKYIATSNDGTLTRHDTVTVNLQYKPVVFAGADTTVCWYVTEIDLHGSATNYKQFGWSTTGTGNFSNTTTFETTYFPTLDDKISGSVDLKLVASSNPPCSGNVTSTRHVVFDVCTGFDGKTTSEPGLLIQPNPAHGTVTIGMKGITSGSAVLSVTSMDGKNLFSEILEGASISVLRKIDISGYARGIYFVQLNTGNKVFTEKMIVQ